MPVLQDGECGPGVALLGCVVQRPASRNLAVSAALLFRQLGYRIQLAQLPVLYRHQSRRQCERVTLQAKIRGVVNRP